LVRGIFPSRRGLRSWLEAVVYLPVFLEQKERSVYREVLSFLFFLVPCKDKLVLDADQTLTSRYPCLLFPRG